MKKLLTSLLVFFIGIFYQLASKPDISLLFIDLKYKSQDHQIKICEFGRGRYAGQIPTSIITNHRNKPMTAPFWPLVWNHLKQSLQANMPIWLIGKPAASMSSFNGHYLENINQLEHDNLFKKQAQRYQNTYPTTLQNHAGLVILRMPFEHERDKNFEQLYDAFKKKYPQFMYLGSVGDRFASCKKRGNSIFNDKKLKKYKPKWGLYEKKYTPNLSTKILHDLACKTVVIKPLNAKKSHGIIIAQAHELNDILKAIISQDIPKNSPKSLHDWYNNNDPYFMVEEFCPGTPITACQKRYDPTIRIVFIAQHDQGAISINILGGYYKLPLKDLDSEGTLEEKHITAIQPDIRLQGIPLPEETFLPIKKELDKVLPEIYKNMLYYGARPKEST